MPLRRHDMGDEPFQFVAVIDQLGEQITQIPFEQHFADVEYDSGDFLHIWRPSQAERLFERLCRLFRATPRRKIRKYDSRLSGVTRNLQRLDELLRYALGVFFPFAPSRETNGAALPYQHRSRDKQQKTARERAGAVAAYSRRESAKVD
jgi:hypothetical protein